MSALAAWIQWLADSVAETIRRWNCHPVATYRLQFQPGILAFRDAAAIVPYLDELGISHLYASPYLKARAGSTHGYAIVDYTRLNPELGSEGDYRAMVAALHKRSMGQILDIVSNHMSATPAENAWWNDVLENGPASPHAACFDIDWHPVKDELRNKILLPILADQYGQVLESGELTLEFRAGALFLRYGQLQLPIEPRSYQAVLSHKLDSLREQPSVDAEAQRELESIITAIEHLPDHATSDPDKMLERQREKEVIKRRLRDLAEQSTSIAEFIQQNVREFNGTIGAPSSFDCLDRLLDMQVYRLAHWKAAADEINYRRFFDVNELAAVCMEDTDVFAESHRLVFELLARGDVDGLRIDHIDGLYAPMAYLKRLQRDYLLWLGRSLHQRAAEAEPLPGDKPEGPPPAWSAIEPAFLQRVSEALLAELPGEPLYVIAEKILGGDEKLPDEWMLAGTTGYDFLNSVSGLFVDPVGLSELNGIYARFVGERFDFQKIAHESKLAVLRAAMSSELQLLAHRLNRISERHRRTRDFTLNTLRIALRDILAWFPVYRTYIREQCVADRDRQVVCRAVAQAKRHNPTTNSAVFDFIRDVLLLEQPPDLDEAGRRERALFVGRVQQVTSPVMAKGMEDTAFYRYIPLISLNEVGSDLTRAVGSIDEFHQRNVARQAGRPRSLLCSSTHDTKRSEDVRARIHVLSEIPHAWRKAVNQWARLNRRHRREVNGLPAPSRNDEYLFYQTLVGTWPLVPPVGRELRTLTDRLIAYMEKATREAKLHTSWTNPDAQYDLAVRQFVAAVLDDQSRNRFLAEFRNFHESVVDWGLFTALSATLLKLTVPGVPDIYQGQELWDFSLVDPDNRRPVDFPRQSKLLARLRKAVGRNDRSLAPAAAALAQTPRDPRLKLLVTWRALQFRRRHAELFRTGEYVALPVEGPKARHLCAFARTCTASADAAEIVAIVLVPRLIAQLTSADRGVRTAAPPVGLAVWGDTRVIVDRLALGPMTNVMTGLTCLPQESCILAADALATFPVALLTK